VGKVKCTFDPSKLKLHDDPADWVLKLLKSSDKADKDIAYLYAAWMLALSTDFPKKYRDLALKKARKQMETVLPVLADRCEHCGRTTKKKRN